MSRWKFAIFCFTLACTGCSGSDTITILQRDKNALEAEVADSLIRIVDDASAQVYLEQHIPRFKVRQKKLKDRISMWEKYSDEDNKKVSMAVEIVREVVFQGKEALVLQILEKHPEGAPFVHLMVESRYTFGRWKLETERIRATIDKLAEQKSFTILEEWRAAGRKGTPRIRRIGEPALGQDVDPEKEWPYLFKAQDPLKELGGNNGKGLV